jgi:phosphodiesterase/alkaline phosphatase D-like protein
MAELVLGPMQRYADEQQATVWVETDASCEVRVLDHTARTFEVHGHHYALVILDGLTPGTTTPYTVELDGRRVWPEPGMEFPPSCIRTRAHRGPVRLLFGSCRTSVPEQPEERRKHGVDMLAAFGQRLMQRSTEEWPDLVFMLGDQVYADETPENVRQGIEQRRDTDQGPGEELADFEEYTWLYHTAWSDPTIRWVLSTLPSIMIFDDHDVRDDWNTSQTWREQIRELDWWQQRIVGGLTSYWVYQHLGNMSPQELATDPLFARVRAAEGNAGPLMDEFSYGVDQDPESVRWSYVRDVGRVRVLAVDCRCARVLTPGGRRMVDETEWAWLREQASGDVDHLVIGTSLPFMMPKGIHDLEGWNEAVCDGVWGRRAARVGEWIRQAVDLEHWAAFRTSFFDMAELVQEVATRENPPATVLFLSGDVHYSYLARARVPGAGAGASAVFQAVCSPIRNPLTRMLRYANVVAQFGVARLIGHVLASAARVPRSSLQWSIDEGPWFDNVLATLELDGRSATVRWDAAGERGDQDGSLRRVADIPLTAAESASVERAAVSAG